MLTIVEQAHTIPGLPNLTVAEYGLVNRADGLNMAAAALTRLQDAVEAENGPNPNSPRFHVPWPTGLPPYDQTIADAKFMEKLSFRLQPTGCVAAVYHGPPNEVKIAPNPLLGITSKYFNAPMSQIYLLNLSWRCRPYGLGLTSLLAIDGTNSGQEWFVGVPTSVYRHIDSVAPIRYGGPLPLYLDKSLFLSVWPEWIKEKISVEPTYIIVPHLVAQRVMMALAQTVSGHVRHEDDIDGALSDLSNLSETSISVQGLQTTGRTVIELTPVIMITLVYMIYLRLSFITKFGHTKEAPWIFKDVLARHAFLVACAVSMIPFVAVLVGNFLFLDVNGYELGIPNIIKLDLRSIIGLGRWRDQSPPLNPQAALIAMLWADITFAIFLVSLGLALKISGALVGIALAARSELQDR